MVDLSGLGKGYAWVNGKSVGRYWSSYLAADVNGCSPKCDYRGAYTSNKCFCQCVHNLLKDGNQINFFTKLILELCYFGIKTH